MAGDPLYEPLGLDRGALATAPRGRRWPLWLGALAVVAVLAGVASIAAARRDHGPDPAVAVVAIDQAPTGSTESGAAAPAQLAEAVPPPAAAKIVTLDPQTPSVSGTTVEMENGVRIVRFNPTASSAAITIPVEGSAAAGLTPAPDPRLVEKTTNGLLPRIGADGRRPADVYARPASVASGPRVAVLLTGMGVDQMATADAGRRLPPDLSFAFAPGAADVAAQVAEARRAGHEVFLDLTRFASQSDAAGEGMAALHRSMARFAGYAGALLDGQTADTVVRDVAGRGVQPLFDGAGTTNDGLAPRADMLIDNGPDGTAFAGTLDRLVALARTRGSAVAIVRDGAGAEASLATLVARLAAQGVTLVPVTSLVAEQGRRAAR